MKTRSLPERSAGGSYDASLDRLEDNDLFPAKTAIAKATLSKAKLPSRKEKLVSSSSAK
ncbi:hypothetical protein [Dyadobacter fanqingshengii]|uniref:Uncharacterized protein n=1 Tax=Dyadobacter fanqingshengii TaxID=2906443 RepID=A0A9X1PFC0_9BACT|nr:hypothetical protein [Dyadobacter fanqingshengii]MCF0042653.1 hypothetical protein [Dyadobacter fanqingshengii]USJ36122.1 hypothetical protein NFI81_26005 [Dyadobacter fanqingshengii]